MDDIKKLFEGVELTEEFKQKFEEIYKARIEEETLNIKEQAETEAEEKYSKLAEQYSAYVVEQTEAKVDQYIAEEVVPSVEKYLDYAVTEYIKENKVVIESNVKVELADKFLSGFKTLAEAYNLDIPVGQDDAITELKTKLAEANEKVDKLISTNDELSEQIQANTKEKIASVVAEDLTDTQKERFVKSVSKVKFYDEEQYKTALSELKESLVPSKEEENKEVEVITEKTAEKVIDPYFASIFSKI